jgi:predicted esterase
MPIWAFHGLEDNVVAPSETINMKNALEGWHPDLKVTLYEGVDHGSWTRALTGELIEWFLTKSK